MTDRTTEPAAAPALNQGEDIGLEGLDIVCLATASWGVVRSVTEYTMLGFARRNRVLIVEPFGSWITQARMARWQNRKRERKPRLEQVAERVWIYRPPQIGVPATSRFALASTLNGWLLAWLLRDPVRQLGFTRPVLWSQLYNVAALFRTFPARLRIYECGDFDAAMARDDRHRQLVLAQEAETCRAADLVFAVTEELAAPLRAHNPATHEVNCAADLDFFGRALDPATEVPARMAALPRPVIGYLGGLDPWKIDVDLLVRMARAHPEWSIALVGYVWFGFDPAPFAACPNIHVLGPQDYDAFPAFLKGMDVCIMPFPLNDITRNGDALKLYEYLAGGRPVVSTNVPAARRLAGAVRIAETHERFIAEVEAALAEPPEAQADRLAAVQPHSWDARNRQKAAHIRDALNRMAR
jgi:glycosyltransferase involved in cell wall biosynthesis